VSRRERHEPGPSLERRHEARRCVLERYARGGLTAKSLGRQAIAIRRGFASRDILARDQYRRNGKASGLQSSPGQRPPTRRDDCPGLNWQRGQEGARPSDRHEAVQVGELSRVEPGHF
jgi:hypothetical protein